MASVRRRPASLYWHAAFRGTDGRLVLRSTKCVDRAKALAAALDFERAAKLAGAGNLVELANKGVASELRMKLTGHKTESAHRSYTHHELEQLRAAVEKIPSLS